MSPSYIRLEPITVCLPDICRRISLFPVVQSESEVCSIYIVLSKFKFQDGDLGISLQKHSGQAEVKGTCEPLELLPLNFCWRQFLHALGLTNIHNTYCVLTFRRA